MKIANSTIDRELGKQSDAGLKMSAATKTDMYGEDDTISTARNVRRYLTGSLDDKFDVFRKSDELAQQEAIPYSAAKWMQRTGKGRTKSYVVDTVVCMPGVSVDSLTKDVRELARKLSVADPATFGLLQCRGVVKVYGPESRKPTAFEFIFQIPPGLHSPRSL